MKQNKSNQHITDIMILIGWLVPIFVSPQYGRFEFAGWNVIYVKIVLAGAPIICWAYFMLFLKNSSVVNKYAIALLLFIYIHALLSDVTEYAQILFFALYAFVVHMIGYNYPKVIFRQYITACKVIAVLLVVDYLAYYLTGSALFLWRNPEIISGIPRMHTIFDEPFHQACFVMPALFWHLFVDDQKNYRTLFILLFVYLSTLSVAAILFLLVPVVYFYMFKKKITLFRLCSTLIVSLLIIAVSGSFILGKLKTATNVEFYNTYNKISSGINYIATVDIIRNTHVQDILLGVGYFNVGNLFADYLVSAPLARYYEFLGYYEGDFVSFGLVCILYSYGLIGIAAMWYLIYKTYKSPRRPKLASTTIWAMLLVFFYSSHTIANYTVIFFLFGLFWGIPDKSAALNLLSFRRCSSNHTSHIISSNTVPRGTKH